MRRRGLALVSLGAVAATSLVLLNDAPAGAVTVDAATATDFQNAVGNATVDVINVTADIQLTTEPGRPAGAPALRIEGNSHTITAAGSDRVLSVLGATGALTVNDAIFTGGNASTGSGGAISWLGDVTLNRTTLTGNQAALGAGGVSVQGDLVLDASTISGNDALNGDAGGAFVTGAVTVVDSTVSGNTVPGHGGGISTSVTGTSPVSITGSTINGNEAGDGAGVYASLADITVTNSTVSGNTGTGGSVGGGLRTLATLTLVYATVVDNLAGLGANVGVVGTGGTFRSFGSVVALPRTGENCLFSPLASTDSQGFNFSDDTSCDFTAPGDVEDGDPGLGALADNGGPTLTRLPQTGSPLIDQIPAASPCGGVNVVVDQRGLPRPTTAGEFCDIGSVEVQPPAPPPGPTPVPTPAAVLVTPTFTG